LDHFTSRFYRAHEITQVFVVSSLYGYYVALSEEGQQVTLLYGRMEDVMLSVIKNDVNRYKTYQKIINVSKKSDSSIGGEIVALSIDELTVCVSVEKRMYLFDARLMAIKVKLSIRKCTRTIKNFIGYYLKGGNMVQDTRF
jgi:hypothetical protein